MTTAATARRAELLEAVGRIVKNLVERYRPECIILFGSLARGECGEWSDIDMAIIKETSAPFLQRMDEARRAADTPVAKDLVVYTPAEWRQMLSEGNYFIRDEILAGGRVLHGDLP